MKFITLCIVLLLVLGFIFYTEDTEDVVKIVGKHSITFGKNVYNDMKEKSDDGDFEDIQKDMKKFKKE